MNRRESFRLTAMAGIAAFLPVSAASADSDNGIPCDLCSFNETLARQIIAETGDWKEAIWARRNPKKPMVVTRHGCCGCEITLPLGAHHPDWVYRMRHLTPEEKMGFHQEYGNVASLLLGMRIGGSHEIRGFIMNGRTEGWNLSGTKVEV